MPAAWSPRDDRQYGHILASCRKRGRYGVARCKSIAAATVNKRRGREGRALGSVSRETGLGALLPRRRAGEPYLSDCRERVLVNEELGPKDHPDWECTEELPEPTYGVWRCAEYGRGYKGRSVCLRQIFVTEASRARRQLEHDAKREKAREREAFDAKVTRRRPGRKLDGFEGVATAVPIAFGSMGLVFLLSLYNKAQAALP
jgi:hypothetical protein